MLEIKKQLKKNRLASLKEAEAYTPQPWEQQSNSVELEEESSQEEILDEYFCVACNKVSET